MCAVRRSDQHTARRPEILKSALRIGQFRSVSSLQQLMPKQHRLSPWAEDTTTRSIIFTRSLAVAKRPCDCCMGQFYGQNITGRGYPAPSLIPMWRDWPLNLSNSVKWRKIRAITPFKVIQGHHFRYQRKPISDFLLVINNNLHLVPFRSYRRLLLKFWCKTITLHFCAPFRVRLGATFFIIGSLESP